MLHIITPGILTTIQDGGRYGYQHMGISVCGAMDEMSFRMANMLLKNDEGEAVLECSVLGPELELGEDCLFAVTGADMSPVLNRCELKNYHVYLGRKGDILKLGSARNGARSYIAFAGGFRLERVMGSCSTDLKCGIGGWQGRKLAAGDELELADPKTDLPFLYKRYEDVALPQPEESVTVHVMEGPQSDCFTVEGITRFYTADYTIQQESDRMGYRLEGEVIPCRETADVISDGIVFGSIQITSAGQPIIMMADHQTTGGYAKIATVISADLPRIAQLLPGQKINFKQVSAQEAAKRARRQEKELRRFQRRTN